MAVQVLAGPVVPHGGARVGEPTVTMIAMPPSESTGNDAATQVLVLDETRPDELDEAWVPVIYADRPALLIWPCSD